MTKAKIKAIMDNVDYMGNGKINYSEFLAATLPLESVLTDKKLFALFKHFDTDNSDFITPDNIREAFS
jgi:calcium-dependent protein kinase